MACARAAVRWHMPVGPATGVDCVKIVVMVPGPARDFWREMPSGNAPSNFDGFH
jgi:hypothetical protein